MATTYYFIAAPADETVLQWFHRHSSDIHEVRKGDDLSLYFREFGSIGVDAKGAYSAELSPLVSVFLPKRKRGVIVTVGELHFLTKYLRTTFPDLERVRRRFQIWLTGMQLAYDRKLKSRPEDTYYFEAGILNVAERVFALPSAAPLIDENTYFIGDHANEIVLDTFCQALRLRGIECQSS